MFNCTQESSSLCYGLRIVETRFLDQEDRQQGRTCVWSFLSSRLPTPWAHTGKGMTTVAPWAAPLSTPRHDKPLSVLSNIPTVTEGHVSFRFMGEASALDMPGPKKQYF